MKQKYIFILIFHHVDNYTITNKHINKQQSQFIEYI